MGNVCSIFDKRKYSAEIDYWQKKKIILLGIFLNWIYCVSYIYPSMFISLSAKETNGGEMEETG